MTQLLIPALASGAAFPTSSSEWDTGHRADRCILNYKTAVSGCNAWGAGSNDVNQWLQIGGFAVPVTCVSVSTQGRYQVGHWIKNYTVSYSNNGIDWIHADNGKIFQGNTDSETIVTQKFEKPFNALAVRINPTEWVGHICLRCELYFKPAVFNPQPAQQFVQYGQTVNLRHTNTKNFLHSHPYKYYHEAGSYEQQVTTVPDNDSNCEFVVKAAHGQRTAFGAPVMYGDVLRLEHIATRKNIHTSEKTAFVTNQREVCAYGNEGIGDANDDWIVQATKPNVTGVLPTDTIRFYHKQTQHYLHAALNKFKVVKDVGPEQNEVTAFTPGDPNDCWDLSVKA